MEGSSRLSECVRVKEEPAEPEAEPEHLPHGAVLAVHVKVEPLNGHYLDSLEEAECIKQETECVKEDPSCSDSECVSKAPMLAGPDNYEVKVEVLQPESVPSPIPSCSNSGCDVSDTAMLAGLYTDHEVKDELVLGVECPHRPDVSLVVNAFAGQWKPEQERPPCRLQYHEAFSSNDTQCIAQTDTKSDTKEVHTRVDYEEPTCEHCGERFARKSDLKKHIMIHTHRSTTRHPHKSSDTKSDTEEKSSEVHIYECDICSKIFQRKNSLKHHIKTHSTQSKSKEFKCNNSGEKSYHCETCGKRFPTRGRLNLHIRTHGDIRPYSCNVCEQRFKYVTHLKDHTRIHGDIRPYLCDICKKGFRTMSNLKNHTEIHSDTSTYSCDVCKKGFRTVTYLKRHTRIHSDIRPHLCDVCKKAFRTVTCLKKHARVHSGEKPYTCKVCNKGFVRQSCRKVHELTHTGEKKFSCDICNKQYTQKKNLNYHIAKSWRCYISLPMCVTETKRKP